MNFYISKFRYKLAFAFIAGIIIIFVNGVYVGSSLGEVVTQYGITFVVLLVISIYCWYPAFRYASTNPNELWSRWGYSVRHRNRKEEFADFQFDRVYEKTMYGMAKEPGKGYRTLTTLENCTCSDFRKNRTPCKHMCKLADILDVYDTDYVNPNAGPQGEHL